MHGEREEWRSLIVMGMEAEGRRKISAKATARNIAGDARGKKRMEATSQKQRPHINTGKGEEEDKQFSDISPPRPAYEGQN